MVFWILLLLIVNGIVSFAYSVTNTADTATVWAMFATNFLFYLGLAQTGVVFSAIMRIAKSEWGKGYSRLGEILTLSFIPAAFILFIIIYIGGTDHLFYWAHQSGAAGAAAGHGHGEAHAHISPWLGKRAFLCRYIVTNVIFYILSIIYFRTGRAEEKNLPVSYNMEKRMNVLASFVMIAYAAVNTNLAWEFGMMIIPHWESTIFPAYYWVGNVFAGSAFIFIIANFFISRAPGQSIDKEHLDSIGKLLIGFTLLWIYMFWSQHMVIWYGDMPELTRPLIKTMSGNYALTFVIMMLAIFVIPFLALIFRKIKLSLNSLFVVAIIICTGVWINRYLMILPVFSDGSAPATSPWTSIALVSSGLALTLISVIIFRKLFPNITVVADVNEH